MTRRPELRNLIIRGALAAITGLTPVLAAAQTDPSYPNYRIRYLADRIEREREGETLIEEGVFNTAAQANEVINVLAHLLIASRVECACDEIRRDVIGASELEDELMLKLSSYGYVARLVPASEVVSLPRFVGVRTPYLILSGDGFRGSGSGNNGRLWNGFDGGATTTLDPNNPRQYARTDMSGIFVDTRLSGYVQTRVGQLMGGYQIDSPPSLCAFAGLDRSPDEMMSWLLIPDLRDTWSGEAGQ